MSLNINTNLVVAVLLADGWHDVKFNTFDLDAYEFKHEDVTILAGGQVKGVPSTGATWIDGDGGRMYCPLTALLAVRTALLAVPGLTKRGGISPSAILDDITDADDA